MLVGSLPHRGAHTWSLEVSAGKHAPCAKSATAFGCAPCCAPDSPVRMWLIRVVLPAPKPGRRGGQACCLAYQGLRAYQRCCTDRVGCDDSQPSARESCLCQLLDSSRSNRHTAVKTQPIAWGCCQSMLTGAQEAGNDRHRDFLSGGHRDAGACLVVTAHSAGQSPQVKRAMDAVTSRLQTKVKTAIVWQKRRSGSGGRLQGLADNPRRRITWSEHFPPKQAEEGLFCKPANGRSGFDVQPRGCRAALFVSPNAEESIDQQRQRSGVRTRLERLVVRAAQRLGKKIVLHQQADKRSMHAQDRSTRGTALRSTGSSVGHADGTNHLAQLQFQAHTLRAHGCAYTALVASHKAVR